MTDDDPTGMKALADSFPLIALAGSSSWTEAQWAEHDAKVAAERGAEGNAEAARARTAKLEGLALRGWPRRALDTVADADCGKPVVSRVTSWNTKAESVLVLAGAPGCGKTTAAAIWAMRQSFGVSFLRATTFAASSRYDAEDRAAWRDASALVLDDLGAEYADAKGNFLVDLDELIDTYYGDRKPLLITTNILDSQAFKQRYGARVSDRLRECGAWYGIGTGSLRRRG